ncbi:sec-independent protein translocase protein TatA [Mucilaginibacter yixingensis]|uniref:Sec-independent protein translocase protein TatA n=1 Tax=Mucilaginibacter yixingensis TaxID=1295612 RepID=A0A2T5JCI5_9SPHI|nr:twin-arginine translocase TatA/TatE family subunit [Mucilaginibacter yixingensis]PTQ99474.1 sec-independent protein translocase protein TatA [Mucilaginibacter yixingensis]
MLAFLNIGTPELILILFVALMLFGGEKLPGLARTLGKGIRDFKDASEGVKREINNQIYNFEEKTPEPAKTETPAEPATPPVAETPATETKEEKPAPKPIVVDTTPVEGTMQYGGYSHPAAEEKPRETDIDKLANEANSIHPNK